MNYKFPIVIRYVEIEHFYYENSFIRKKISINLDVLAGHKLFSIVFIIIMLRLPEYSTK